MKRLPCMVVLLLATAVLQQPSHAAEMNLFEWIAVAPVVVSGRTPGEDGKTTDIHVERVFRGKVLEGDVLSVQLRMANRDRDRLLDPKPLRLLPGKSYVVLLEEAPERKKDGGPLYRVVRGVRGARELPAEGAGPVIAALERFVSIQDSRSEAVIWRDLGFMLEEGDPVLLDTALQQFLKFRRGEPKLLLSLRPILDHPGPELRAKACRLIGRIVLRHADDVIPEESALRAELIARARRDEAVPVRVAATEALEGFGGEGILEVLDRIAAEDPEQSVRYAAELVLLRLRGADEEEPAPTRAASD